MGLHALTLAFFFLFIFTQSLAPNVLAAPDPNQAPQQPVLSDSGAIKGIVNFCGAQGNNGTVLSLLGHSFDVLTDASGAFSFNYVPAGTYDMKIQIPGEVPTILGVQVEKNKITQLGTVGICPDNDGDGFTVDVDCNDNNPMVNPGASETCDGIDNNCDGQVDEGCTTCTDSDLDGFFAQAGCGTIEDCDDSDNTIFPNATEVCDGVDNDCDAEIDENFDGDNDTFTSCGGDCNDDNANINPDATEVCDGVDNNCEGSIDEGFDVDADGVTTCDGDCDDNDAANFPGNTEVCDQQDNNCDGDVDEGGVCGLPIGTSCSSDTECESGSCADGVCCLSDCDGICESCNQQLSVGSCEPYGGGTDPESECTPFTCSGLTSCLTSCATNDECTPGFVCDLGSCVLPLGCTDDSECGSGEFCNGNSCQPKKASGESCLADNECISEVCQVGTCQ